MSLETWIAFCVLETVLCFTPGPAVLYVTSTALARGARPGMAAAGGIVAGNLFYFALSGTGVAAVILASGTLFTVLKTAGAAYLVWMGLRMLIAPGAPPPGEAAPAPRERRAFLRGFVVQGANPKALVFFVALLPQFIDPAGSVATQIAILTASSQAIELAVLALYVWVAVRARALAGTRLARPLERVGGGFLVAAGARLAFVRIAPLGAGQ